MPNIKEEFRCRSIGLGWSHPHQFVTSQWNLSQGLFIAWRAFWFVWHTGWLIRSFQLEISKEDYPGEWAKWFIYLTNWSYLILFIQSGWHLTVVIHHTRKGKTEPAQFKDEGTSWYLKVLWLLTNVGFDAAVIVTILYWALVFKKLKYALSIMTHAVNMLYVVLDIFVYASPVRLLHVLYSCVYGAIFIAFSIFYHLGDGTNSDSDPYIYSALDWKDTGTTAGLAAGVIIGAIPLAHLFQFALYTFRLYLSETCGSGNKTASSDLPVHASARDTETGEAGVKN